MELLLGFNLGILDLSHLLLNRVASLLALAQRFPPSAQAGQYYMGSRAIYFRVTAELCGKAQKVAGEYAIGFASIEGRDARLALQSLQKIGMGFQGFWLEHGQMMLQGGHMVPIHQ